MDKNKANGRLQEAKTHWCEECAGITLDAYHMPFDGDNWQPALTKAVSAGVQRHIEHIKLSQHTQYVPGEDDDMPDTPDQEHALRTVMSEIVNR